jgi:hypothetical protein
VPADSPGALRIVKTAIAINSKIKKVLRITVLNLTAASFLKSENYLTTRLSYNETMV